MFGNLIDQISIWESFFVLLKRCNNQIFYKIILVLLISTMRNSEVMSRTVFTFLNENLKIGIVHYVLGVSLEIIIRYVIVNTITLFRNHAWIFFWVNLSLTRYKRLKGPCWIQTIYKSPLKTLNLHKSLQRTSIFNNSFPLCW